MATAEPIKVSVQVETDAAIAGLKRVERQARRTARALAELREVISDPDLKERLERAGLKVEVVFVDEAEPKEA